MWRTSLSLSSKRLNYLSSNPNFNSVTSFHNRSPFFDSHGGLSPFSHLHSSTKLGLGIASPAVDASTSLSPDLVASISHYGGCYFELSKARLRLMAASRKLTPSFLLKHTSFSSSITAISPTSSQTPNFEPQLRFHSTSPYMNQLFPKSNSSFKLTTGNSLQSDVVRLSEDVFLVDSGIGTPRVCLQDELIGANKKDGNNNTNTKIRFQNRVGFLDLVAGEPPINKQLLERFFIDLVTGDSIAKERATARFNELLGGAPDVDAIAKGEPLLVLPRRYRQKRAFMELNKIWRNNGQVKGFIVGRVRGGYSVAIAGFIAFLPFRPLTHVRRMWNDRFTIESINHKTGNIRVL